MFAEPTGCKRPATVRREASPAGQTETPEKDGVTACEEKTALGGGLRVQEVVGSAAPCGGQR